MFLALVCLREGQVFEPVPVLSIEVINTSLNVLCCQIYPEWNCSLSQLIFVIKSIAVVQDAYTFSMKTYSSTQAYTEIYNGYIYTDTCMDIDNTPKKHTYLYGVWVESLLGIPGFPPGMPYGFVRIIFFFFFFFFFLFFLFFRRQGFRMITFDRQAGPLQNFNRSHIMVIGRSVLFSDPARPPGGGVGRPKHPKIPPPPPKNKFLFACVSEPQEHF